MDKWMYGWMNNQMDVWSKRPMTHTNNLLLLSDFSVNSVFSILPTRNYVPLDVAIQQTAKKKDMRQSEKRIVQGNKKMNGRTNKNHEENVEGFGNCLRFSFIPSLAPYVCYSVGLYFCQFFHLSFYLSSDCLGLRFFLCLFLCPFPSVWCGHQYLWTI